MSFHERITSDNTAGRLIEVFTDILLINPYWSKVDDTANGMSANEAVFRCYDPSGVTEYFLVLRNNQAGYADVELWEGWDSVTHAGVGASVVYISSTYQCRIWYNAGHKIQLHDFCFAYLDAVNQNHYFIGRPQELFDETKNIVMILCRSTHSSNMYNPMGYGYGTGTATAGKFLFDENGAQTFLSLSTMPCPETISGTILLGKTIIRNDSTYKAVGCLHGNICCGASIPGVYRGQIRYDENGNAWEAVGLSTSTYNSYIMRA